LENNYCFSTGVTENVTKNSYGYPYSTETIKIDQSCRWMCRNSPWVNENKNQFNLYSKKDTDPNTTPRSGMVRTTDDRHHDDLHHIQDHLHRHCLHHRRACSSSAVKPRRFNPESGSGSCLIHRDADRQGFRKYFDSGVA